LQDTNLIEMSSVQQAIKDWIPYKFITVNEAICCRWLYTGDKAFTAPFFDETISACRSLPENSKLISSLSSPDVLLDWASQIVSVPPAAIIFHVSRCGSTLASQLLALQQANIVLSEVPFFDELLRMGKKGVRPDTLQLLMAAIALYGAPKNAQQQRLFIKTDSWHIHFYKELRQLYPEVPFILLYRKPDEVLRSQQKNRGMHAVPGVVEPAVFGLDEQAVMHMGFDEYMAKVMEGYLEAFAAILQTDQHAMAINYNEGAVAMMQKIAGATGMMLSAGDVEAIQQRAGFHAKYPGQVFAEPAMQQPIPVYLKSAFDWYTQLEQIRNAIDAP
jgi:hypothetical protein